MLISHIAKHNRERGERKRNHKSREVWSELNDFAKNYWRFFMQLCLCGALKIIIMYIISMVSSIYTAIPAPNEKEKRNLFQYASYFTCSLPRRYNVLRRQWKREYDAFIQKE